MTGGEGNSGKQASEVELGKLKPRRQIPNLKSEIRNKFQTSIPNGFNSLEVFPF